MINKHKPFVRICLVHLIAANMSVWLSACTTEIVEDVGEMFADEKVEETNGKFKSVVKCNRRIPFCQVCASRDELPPRS